MRLRTGFLFIATMSLSGQPGYAAPAPNRQWAILAARLFPTVSMLERSPSSGGLPRHARAMLAERARRMEACRHLATCLFHAGLWTDAEIAEMSADADRALEAGAPKGLAADGGTRAQVVRELNGLNNILQVYGLGRVPPYPQIDGPKDAESTVQFTATTQDAVALGEAATDDPATALDPSLALALALLDANDRDVAAAFEPLDQRYNGAAIGRARIVDWSRYRYSAIIVPGIGPEDLDTPLSARGKLNVRMAAGRFAAGLAPFIVVTGGTVHPKGTKSVEAIEMRRALIEQYGVPADCIVVEPYARHTTTNLRNATRRLVALGAPLDRDTLIITNAEQSRYIESPEFKARNEHELGYQPGTVGNRQSAVELVFRPAIASLRIDPGDPLDP